MKICLEQIHKLIQEPYLSRGKEYFNDGMVKIIDIKSDSVKALIAGTYIYKVSLKIKDAILEGHCSCPAFTDFGPCKHIAATCFAVLGSSYENWNREASYRFDDYENLEKYLKTLKKSTLIKIILNISDEYPEIVVDHDF